MSKDNEKTNVMRILDQKKVPYEKYHYDFDVPLSGVEAVKKLNIPEEVMFKTLVTVGKTKEHYVFVIPVAEELDLKKAAKVTGEKSIEMIAQKELLPLTGYIHGGCSPIGMKKFFATYIDESATNKGQIVFSAGRVGYHVKVSLDELEKVIRFKFVDLLV